MTDMTSLTVLTVLPDICNMYILLVAATKKEIEPTIQWLQQQQYQVQDHEVDVLITGIGGIHTTYLLSYNIHLDRPDYIVQAGIAGSFTSDFPPGSLLFIDEEVHGDLGVEENEQFKDVFELQLQEINTGPYTGRFLVNPYCNEWQEFDLPFDRGITVNEVTTQPKRVQQIQQKYDPVVETMEGAAFHYTALMEKIPFMQLRAISNYVGERNKANWQIKEAIGGLNEQLIKILKSEW